MTTVLYCTGRSQVQKPEPDQLFSARSFLERGSEEIQLASQNSRVALEAYCRLPPYYSVRPHRCAAVSLVSQKPHGTPQPTHAHHHPAPFASVRFIPLSARMANGARPAATALPAAPTPAHFLTRPRAVGNWLSSLPPSSSESNGVLAFCCCAFRRLAFAASFAALVAAAAVARRPPPAASGVQPPMPPMLHEREVRRVG